MIKDRMMEVLRDMDKAAKAFDTVDFTIYFLGGAACILGQYTDRATRDFDFIDLNYDAKMGRVFSLLRDFDMLEYESTALAPDYKSRARKIDGLHNFTAYVLAPEDIIASKIIRLEEKDIEDIDSLMDLCDKTGLKKIIDSILCRDDLYPAKKQAFSEKLLIFKDRYHV